MSGVTLGVGLGANIFLNVSNIDGAGVGAGWGGGTTFGNGGGGA